jgi:hypothetical protein
VANTKSPTTPIRTRRTGAGIRSDPAGDGRTGPWLWGKAPLCRPDAMGQRGPANS